MLVLFRASRDGFNCDAFHRHCDGIGATVTVGRVSSNGILVGGYTSVTWFTPQNEAHLKATDDRAFVFNNRKRSDTITKFGVVRGREGNAVYHYTSYGARFGDGSDLLFFYDDATYGRETGKEVRKGKSRKSVYQIGDGAYELSGTGQYTFDVDEVEVFAV